MSDFRCQKCGTMRTEVIDSRSAGPFRFRRRRLCKCGHRFSTYEIPADEWQVMRLDGGDIAMVERSVQRLAKRLAKMRVQHGKGAEL